MYCNGEQWSQHEERVERDENDRHISGDEEVQSVSRVNLKPWRLSRRRTGRWPKDDRRSKLHEQHDDQYPRDRQQRQHANQRDDVFFVVVFIWPVTVLIETNRLERFKGSRDNMKGEQGSGRGKGLSGYWVCCFCQS